MATPRLTQAEFIRRAKEIHGNTYSYRKTVYEFAKQKVIITCKTHGDFLQTPRKHYSGVGCPKCADSLHKQFMSGRTVVSKDEFLQKAQKKFGADFEYRRYTNFTSEFQVKCPTHGWQTMTPQHHLRLKFGCPECGRNRKTTEEFIAQARRVHGGRYDYSKTECSKCGAKVVVVCKTHGEFSISQRKHLIGQGCPGCCSPGHSQIAIRWLEVEAKRRRMKNVLHAENGGEYRIPGTSLRVDGFHARTKTVFEFYGDAYHGNLNRYKPDSRPNPYDKSKTAKQLYDETIRRENKLISLGYRVISIWERDFRAQLRTFNKESHFAKATIG